MSKHSSNVHAFDSIDNVEKMEHARYGRSGHSRRRTLKIMMLSAALAVAVLVILVESIYTSIRISSLNQANTDLKRALAEAQEEIAVMRPEMERVKGEIEQLVKGRFPNLQELQTNQVMHISGSYVKNVLFTTIKQRDRQLYKYLLVMENNSTAKIKPSFRVLLFDQYGVHVATDERHDDRALSPGESRDYTAELEFLFETQPAHFYIDDITTQSGNGN